MRGRISYLESSISGKTHGFIRGFDGRSYWFLFTRDNNVNCGDDVLFEGARDEKGYVATLVQTVNHTPLC